MENQINGESGKTFPSLSVAIDWLDSNLFSFIMFAKTTLRD